LHVKRSVCLLPGRYGLDGITCHRDSAEATSAPSSSSPGWR